jgi:hypothetical protein
MTTTILPAAMSARISSTLQDAVECIVLGSCGGSSTTAIVLLPLDSRRRQVAEQALDVARHLVDLEVDAPPRREVAERQSLPGYGE